MVKEHKMLNFPLLVAIISIRHIYTQRQMLDAAKTFIFVYEGGKFQSLSSVNIFPLDIFPNKTFPSFSVTECALFCLRQEECVTIVVDLDGNKCNVYGMTNIERRSYGLFACPKNYTFYRYGSETFCFKVISSWETKASGILACKQDGGRLAALVEDEKHTVAAQIAKDVYNTSSRSVWVDVLMDSTTSTWHWPDGTRVNEDRFAKNGEFYGKDPSKPCAYFISELYFVGNCSKQGSVLCETDLVKISASG